MGVYLRNKIFWIDYRYQNRRFREPGGPTKKIAEDKLHRRKHEIAVGIFTGISPKNNINFSDFADEYLEIHCKVNNKKSWKTADRHNIKKLKEFFCSYQLNEITPKHVQEFKNKRAKEVTPATVNRQLACLKSMFNRATEWEKYDGKNPVKGIKLFKENNKRLRFLEKEEIARLLDNCNKNIKPIVILALNTGMRKGEIMKLKWRDIDFKRDIISLYNTKNGEQRQIPMNTPVKDTLIKKRKHPDSDLVFTKKNGQPYGDFKKSFLKALDKSGIKEFRFHDLRHTFASHLAMNGVDLNTIRELLGHKTMTITLRYAHLSPSFKKKAVEKLGEAMVTNWSQKVIENGEDEIKNLLNSLNINNLNDNAGVAQLVEQLTCNQ